MASSVPENWALVEIGVSEINSALLISLFEESQVDDSDDERLRSVMRSLQAEIDPTMTDGHNSLVELELDYFQEDCQLSDSGNVDCQDDLMSHDLDFSWIDMEMSPPSSPSDHMTSWYMDICGDEMDGLIEFEGVRDYSKIYFGVVPFEEHGYSSLWQETYMSE